MKQRFFLLLLSTLAIFFTHPAFAASANETTVFFSEQAIAQGYTLTSTNQNMRLGISTGVLTIPGRVSLVSSPDNAIAETDGLRFLSGQYLVSIAQETPKVLPRPYRVLIRHTEQSTHAQVVFYNGSTKHWQLVKTKGGNGTVTASLPYPYVRVAVVDAPPAVPALSLRAHSAAILDETSGAVLIDQHGGDVRSIASLSKLMTALVGVGMHPKWTKIITYSSADEREGARLAIQPGEQMTVRDAFATMLIGSANNATMAFVHSLGISDRDFVQRMNDMALSLGLTSTHFAEPTGLNARNVSTADEYAIVARAALAVPDILSMTSRTSYAFSTINTKRFHRIKTTNELLAKNRAVLAGKTGYIDEAGYCFIAKVQKGGRGFITVILGSPSSQGRFTETEALIRMTSAFL